MRNDLKISISVVSHAQINLIQNLLRDIDEYCSEVTIELILTLNLVESLPFDEDDFSFPIKVVHNPIPLGFGANHNQAFKYASGEFFCVLNPDIRFNEEPFSILHAVLKDASIGVVAPLVLGVNGEIEDSVRHFPSPLKILCKVFGGCKDRDYVIGIDLIFPDWAGGMFLLFPAVVFEKLCGFDQRYYMYYEDVDLCARLRLMGYEVALSPQAQVTHHAQRSSHRNFKFLRWHLRSMLRFFLSSVYWRVQFRKWLRKTKV